MANNISNHSIRPSRPLPPPISTSFRHIHPAPISSANNITTSLNNIHFGPTSSSIPHSNNPNLGHHSPYTYQNQLFRNNNNNTSNYNDNQNNSSSSGQTTPIEKTSCHSNLSPFLNHHHSSNHTCHSLNSPNANGNPNSKYLFNHLQSQHTAPHLQKSISYQPSSGQGFSSVSSPSPATNTCATSTSNPIDIPTHQNHRLNNNSMINNSGGHSSSTNYFKHHMHGHLHRHPPNNSPSNVQRHIPHHGHLVHHSHHQENHYQWPATPTAAAPKPFILTVAEKLLSKHTLNPAFLSQYAIHEELGSGGFGFVCSAFKKLDSREVAVKFIIKSRVPAQGWAKDSVYGIIPLECYFIRKIKHPNIVGFIDYFEDGTFSYLITELHGSPWAKNTSPSPSPVNSKTTTTSHSQNNEKMLSPVSATCPNNPFDSIKHSPSTESIHSTPTLTDSVSPALSASSSDDSINASDKHDSSTAERSSLHPKQRENILKQIPASPPPSPIPVTSGEQQLKNKISLSPAILSNKQNTKPSTNTQLPRKFTRRSSCDLFECIEQHEKFTESQAKHVFSQIVSAVHFLHANGVVHRDIKDENILVDKDFNVKLIDFGSASFIPSCPEKLFDRFLGTVQYAAPEIFRGEKYKGPEAEIWALGCCLYIMLTGQIPFETMNHTLKSPFAPIHSEISRECRQLLEWMLEKSPQSRPTIRQVLHHPWLSRRISFHNCFRKPT